MEKRHVFLLLLALGGGGYAAYTHREAIMETLGLDELAPARIKAVKLAKKSSDFKQGVTNWQYIQTRAARGDIEVAGDPWMAVPIAGEEYRVSVRWVEDDEPVAHAFKVNVATRAVVYERALGAAASPR